jgi:hypothetical protein
MARGAASDRSKISDLAVAAKTELGL